MEDTQHSHKVLIDLDRIRGNYRHLCRAAESSGASKLAGVTLPPIRRNDSTPGRLQELAWPEVIAVIKADAYGHGHIQVARALMKEGAALFASGSVAEAVSLRKGLWEEVEEDDGVLPGIIALLGVMNESDVLLAAEAGIIPVIHSLEQLPLLAGTRAPLAVALKFNSGMYRLGFDGEQIDDLLRELRKMPHIMPVLALSHLASADTEQGRQAAHSQATVFADMLEKARKAFPALAASLANTAGTLMASEIEAAMGPHICRPGIGLYGGNPFYGTSLEGRGEGLLAAMSVSAPIIAVRDLPMGCGIGYGHTFRAVKDMRVGIVAAGYADMYPRFMSNHGQVSTRGGLAPVLGRVAMQMTAVDLEHCEDAKPGDEAWLLGGPYESALSAQDLAALWDTISYEVFCLLGHGHRTYEAGA